MTDKIHNIVLEDRKLKVPEIARKVGISNEHYNVFHNDLQRQKLSARGVLHFIIME